MPPPAIGCSSSSILERSFKCQSPRPPSNAALIPNYHRLKFSAEYLLPYDGAKSPRPSTHSFARSLSIQNRSQHLE
ncbi:hypothetical protein L484_005449 [Morus notabilis]|uniref:Uncharacterized protein n=1 Tax=Morus notabilis TaxID=981085 RepID=W9SU10_9ROSA|nr:hypothetical protein L484_005449 [Morus notabilis]